MPWIFAHCGEVLGDSFDACWHRGTPATDWHQSHEPTDSELAELGAAEEAAAMEKRNRFNEAVWEYKERAGWFPATYSREARAGAGLHRLVVAYRLYRGRHEASSRRARPDLDRKWTAFAIMLGLTGGIIISLFVSDTSWIDAVLADETRFVIVWLGLLLGTVITGQRAVGAELQAAAEYEVARGMGS